jgi:predicted nucleic acid-binding protein
VSVALFDTHVLLALAWPNHQHHAEAHAWFAARARNGWATYAFTRLGFIRLSSNSAYTPDAVSPQDAALLLRQWTLRKEHRFLPSSAAHDSKIYTRAIGHRQVNDAGWSRLRAGTGKAGYPGYPRFRTFHG